MRLDNNTHWLTTSYLAVEFINKSIISNRGIPEDIEKQAEHASAIMNFGIKPL